MNKKISFIILLFSIFCSAQSQPNNFADEIKTALYIHDTASVVSSEIKSLASFDKLIKKYPSEWLAPFWASYLCTQISRLDKDPSFPKDMSPVAYLEKSQSYFDLAKKVKGQMNDRVGADFHALQGFIYSFYTVGKSTKDEGGFDTKMNEEYKQTLALNPLEYNLSVMFAINQSNMKDPTYKEIQTVIVVLENAKSILDKFPNRGMTTFWSADFIGFWKGRAEKALKKLLDTKS